MKRTWVPTVGALAVAALAFWLAAPVHSDDAAGTVSGALKVKGAKSARDIVIYLEKQGGGTFAPPAEHAVMDQKKLMYVPRVLPILKGTTVDILNGDTVVHNTFSPDDVMDKVDLGNSKQGEKRSFTFKKPGVATLLCKIHPEMVAYVVVLEAPYFTVSEAPEKGTEGKFSIKGVPPGTYTLKTWHERLKETTRPVTVTAGQTVVDLELSK